MARTVASAPAIAMAPGPVPRAHRTALWSAPLRATKRQTLWWSLAWFGICCVAAVACGIWATDVRGRFLAMFFYATGVASVWAFCLSSLALLARDAHALAIPRAARNAARSAWAYGALTLAIPAGAAAALGWNAMLATTLAVIALVGGLAFVLLPRWFSTWMGFLPAIYIGLHQRLHVLSPLGPGFVYVALLVSGVLLIAVAASWWRIVRGEGVAATGWRSPMILQLRQQAVSGSWAFDKQLLWRNNGKQCRHANLHGIDARTPVKAIEVSLGALFVPQTAAGNLRRLAAGVWPVVVFALAMGLVNLGHLHDVRRILALMAVSGAMWVGAFGTAMTLLLAYTMLKRQWDRGQEVALLALLPGLGRHASPHRSLMRAAFIKPFGVCAALWLLMIACEWLSHLGGVAVGLTTLMVFSLAGATAMLLLRMLAGRPLHRFVLGLMSAAGFVLMCGSLLLAYLVKLARLGSMATLAEWGLLALWMVFGAWMIVLAMRAWRAFKCRPHPFLTS